MLYEIKNYFHKMIRKNECKGHVTSNHIQSIKNFAFMEWNLYRPRPTKPLLVPRPPTPPSSCLFN